MLSYYILLLLLLFSSFLNRYTQKRLYPIAFLLLLFLGVFRGGEVGTDNYIYSANYRFATMNPTTWSRFTDFEPGFAWFLAFTKTYIYDNYYFFRALIFIIFMIGVNFVIKRYCKNQILGLFFLVVVLCYTGAFNIMRQYTALGLLCFAIPLLENKNKRNLIVYEIIIFCLTFLIHRSIIIASLLPVFLYVQKINQLFQNKMLMILLLSVSFVVLFFSDRLYDMIPFLSNSIVFMGDKYINYITHSVNTEEQLSVFSCFLTTLYTIYVVSIYPKEEKTNIFFICLILSVFLLNILGSINVLFIRVSTNFAFFKFILFANIWYLINDYYKRKTFRYITLIYCLILFTNSMIKNYGEVVPYVFL